MSKIYLQEKLTGQKGQVIGFDDYGNAVAQDNTAGVMPQITVAVFSGSTVTCKSEDGKSVVTGESADGICAIDIPSFGTWTIQATFRESLSYTETIEISEAKVYPSPTVTLSFPATFGVVWNRNSSDTRLTRLERLTDDYGFVTEQIAKGDEPVPAIGAGSGSSPFDEYAPWSGMIQRNMDNGGVLSYRQNEQGFTRSLEIFVYIPEFYFKVIDRPATSQRYFYISEKSRNGFDLHPGSGRFVARYNSCLVKATNAPTMLYSLSGKTNWEHSRAEARTYARNRGNQFCLYDYASWCAVCLLYLVEFANWNSQAMIGAGNVSDPYIIYENDTRCGGTDIMTYHTGCAGTRATAVQYRGIENPWGNVWEWTDGVNFIDRKVYICTDPDKFADDTTDNYEDSGVITLEEGSVDGAPLSNMGFIGSLIFSSEFPWAIIPGAVGGTSEKYIPDKVEINPGNRVLMVGGGIESGGGTAGMFCFHGGADSDDKSLVIGSRLMYIPKEGEVA